MTTTIPLVVVAHSSMARQANILKQKTFVYLNSNLYSRKNKMEKICDHHGVTKNNRNTYRFETPTTVVVVVAVVLVLVFSK